MESFKLRYRPGDPEPDLVDQETADKLNELLAARGPLDEEVKRFIVCGLIRQNSWPLVGGLVRAFDRGMRREETQRV